MSHQRPRALTALALAVGLSSGLAACAGASSEDNRTLTVFAAASLSGAFERIGAEFEAAHDGVRVEHAFAGSSDLVAQLEQGAPADVVATADEETMRRLADAGLVTDPVPFATNTLRIAVPPDNPGGVRSLLDLAAPDVQVVVCAPAVPCGAATRAASEAAGVELRPVSEEQSVTDVLNKVRSGEADAGVVYATDVRAAGTQVRGIELPEAVREANVYPVATVAGTDREALAEEFVGLVLGREGQRVLRDLGFGRP